MGQPSVSCGNAELDRAQRLDQRERVVQGHAGLRDDPRVPSRVRPRRGVHEERVAQEDVPGPAGGQRRWPGSAGLGG